MTRRLGRRTATRSTTTEVVSRIALWRPPWAGTDFYTPQWKDRRPLSHENQRNGRGGVPIIHENLILSQKYIFRSSD